MSITTVTDRLVQILGDINGIPDGGVFGGRPDDVMPAVLPAFVILTGSATYDPDSEGMSDITVETRTYRLMLLAQSWVEGTELSAEIACRPFFSLMQTAFMHRQSLGYPGKPDAPLRYVQTARLTGDSGVVNIILSGVAYAGVEWTLEVKEYIRSKHV